MSLVMDEPSLSQPTRLAVDGDQVRDGLGRLVLTLVRLLHELMEKQALRRLESGSLTDAEVERVGLALMRQAEEIERLCEVFELDYDDLNLELGPLGPLV